MATKLCFLLILTCLYNNACFAQDFVPQLKNNYLELFQFKNKKLKQIKAFDSTQVVLNEDCKTELYYNRFAVAERWAYSPKHRTIAYYNLYLGIDSLIKQEIHLVYLSKKGRVEKRDTLMYLDQVAIENIRFFDDLLLIEGQSPEFNGSDDRNSFVRLKEQPKKLHHFDRPSSIELQRFRFLAATASYGTEFYSLQTDFISNYSLHSGIGEGENFRLPKIIEKEVWDACSGHDYVQIMGKDALTFNDKWLVIGVDYGCFGQMTMFEDCFGMADMIAILDRSTMKLKYLLNDTGYSCGQEEETEEPKEWFLPRWNQIKIVEDALYFVSDSTVRYLDLGASNLEAYRFEETEDDKIRAQKTVALIAEIRTFKLPFGPPYELSELSNNNSLIHNRKKGFYFNKN